MIAPDDALQRLRDGNRRFVAGQGREEELAVDARRQALLGGQHPFATVLGCGDSRVPAEIIFDLGLGDLFVVRVAGNVVGDACAGSVEFAVEKLGTRLVVVLGHEGCGAVSAALQELRDGVRAESPYLRVILDRVVRAVRPLWESKAHLQGVDLENEGVRANARAAAAELTRCSPILARRVAEGRLRVVAAQYSLESGVVDFLEG